MHDDDELDDLRASQGVRLVVGDVVELCIGSPRMLVQEVQRGQAVCCWFEDRTLMIAEFPGACLLKIGG